MTDTDLLSSAWDALPRRAPGKQRRALEELRTWLGTQTGSVAIALLTDPSGQWSEEEMATQLFALLERFSPERRGKLMAGLFRCVVTRWLQLTSKSYPLPSIVTLAERARHPRRRGLVAALRARRLLGEELSSAIRAMSSGAAVRHPDPLALAILSSICMFRCLHGDSIVSILEACADPKESFFLVDGHMALWHSLPVNGVPHVEHRVTVLDPLTAVLLLRVDPADAKAVLDRAEATGGSLAKKRDAALRELSDRIEDAVAPANPGHKRCSVQQMVAVCEIAAYQWLPPCVISYLTRRLVSGSTPPEVILRIEPSTVLLTCHATEETCDGDKPSHAGRNVDPEADFALQERPLPNWSHDLADALSGRKLRLIRRQLSGLVERADGLALERCLAEFALVLAEPRGRKTLDPNTLSTYMRLLLRHLAPHFEQQDPITAGQMGADEIYEEAWLDFLQSKSGKSYSCQSRFAVIISRFHEFLIDKYEAKPLEDFSPWAAGARPIDANIVSLEEFAGYLSKIAGSSLLTPKQKPQAFRVAHLGMLGFRHSEAYNLQPVAVDSEYVNVHKNKFCGVKTPNSVRRLRTSIMPGQEGRRLRKLAEKRKKEREDSMFHSGVDGFPDDEGFFASMLKLLQDSCDDSSLRFHTLRHSAATLLVLALLCAESPSLEALLPNCRRTLQYIRGGANLRNQIYASTKVRWPDLHVVANLLGHGSAKTTSLPVYCHGLWMAHAGLLMDHADLAPSLPDLVRASGWQPATAYRWLEQSPYAVARRMFETRFKAEIREAAEARLAMQEKKEQAAVMPERLSEFELSMELGAALIRGLRTDAIAETESAKALLDEVKAILNDLSAGAGSKGAPNGHKETD